MKKFLYLTLGAIFAFTPANTAEYVGKLTRVIDGDTVDLLTEYYPGKEGQKTIVRIRLSDIDAPESGQPYGNRSKETLSLITNNTEIRVEDKGQDRYGRTLATIYNIQCNASDDCGEVNINAQMVISGMAWAYRYRGKPNDLIIAQYEKEAKQNGRGLWQDPNPIDPYQWRKGNR